MKFYEYVEKFSRQADAALAVLKNEGLDEIAELCYEIYIVEPSCN